MAESYEWTCTRCNIYFPYPIVTTHKETEDRFQEWGNCVRTLNHRVVCSVRQIFSSFHITRPDPEREKILNIQEISSSLASTQVSKEASLAQAVNFIDRNILPEVDHETRGDLECHVYDHHEYLSFVYMKAIWALSFGSLKQFSVPQFVDKKATEIISQLRKQMIDPKVFQEIESIMHSGPLYATHQWSKKGGSLRKTMEQAVLFMKDNGILEEAFVQIRRKNHQSLQKGLHRKHAPEIASLLHDPSLPPLDKETTDLLKNGDPVAATLGIIRIAYLYIFGNKRDSQNLSIFPEEAIKKIRTLRHYYPATYGPSLREVLYSTSVYKTAALPIEIEEILQHLQTLVPQNDMLVRVLLHGGENEALEK